MITRKLSIMGSFARFTTGVVDVNMLRKSEVVKKSGCNAFRFLQSARLHALHLPRDGLASAHRKAASRKRLRRDNASSAFASKYHVRGWGMFASCRRLVEIANQPPIELTN